MKFNTIFFATFWAFLSLNPTVLTAQSPFKAGVSVGLNLASRKVFLTGTRYGLR